MQFGHRTLDLSTPQIMGILNVTPDSFSDGGRYQGVDAALKQAESMLSQGASIVDVGGESTRPGATPVGAQEEMERVLPVVEAIAQRIDVTISVDTSNPQLMTSAAHIGAHLLNDVRALQQDGALKAAAKSGLPVCLMHMQGTPETMQQAPQYLDVVADVLSFLKERIRACTEAGIEANRLIIDPGFGFGKTTEYNYRLLAELKTLQTLNRPILAGLSRKRMIGEVTSQPIAEQRVHGSAAGALIAAINGANILRVHDVQATKAALDVWLATEHSKNNEGK